MRLLTLAALTLLASLTHAQIVPAPERKEGEGPYTQLILRNVTVINGAGAPAFGPADVVIEGNRIMDVAIVGFPGVPVDPQKRPVLREGGREMDLSGHYLMPGIVDMHAHIAGKDQGVPAEYSYKLWLGHGVTTVREPGCFDGLEGCVSESRRSAANAITAPRILPFAAFGLDRKTPFTTPEQARQWVREVQKKGALGIKCMGYRPDIMQAGLDEVRKLGMGSACHHAQLEVARVNVLDTARWGLGAGRLGNSLDPGFGLRGCWLGYAGTGSGNCKGMVSRCQGRL